MPKATLNMAETERKELKTLEGGFVVLRRMSYGQMQERKALMKLTIGGSSKSKDFQGEMELASKKIAEFSFKSCIVEHNLNPGDDESVLLDFNSPVDVASLHPRVGSEIEKYIDEMNNFEDDDQEN